MGRKACRQLRHLQGNARIQTDTACFTSNFEFLQIAVWVLSKRPKYIHSSKIAKMYFNMLRIPRAPHSNALYSFLAIRPPMSRVSVQSAAIAALFAASRQTPISAFASVGTSVLEIEALSQTSAPQQVCSPFDFPLGVPAYLHPAPVSPEFSFHTWRLTMTLLICDLYLMS